MRERQQMCTRGTDTQNTCNADHQLTWNSARPHLHEQVGGGAGDARLRDVRNVGCADVVPVAAARLDLGLVERIDDLDLVRDGRLDRLDRDVAVALGLLAVRVVDERGGDGLGAGVGVGGRVGDGACAAAVVVSVAAGRFALGERVGVDLQQRACASVLMCRVACRGYTSQGFATIVGSVAQRSACASHN